MATRRRKQDPKGALLAEIVDGIMRLRAMVDPTNDELRRFETLAQYAVMAIAIDQPELRARVERAWRVAFDGRVDDADGIGIRRVAAAIERAEIERAHPNVALYILQELLNHIDPAFTVVARDHADAWKEALEASMDRRVALTGRVADLLIAAGALGTSPKARRDDVQRRVTRALKAGKSR
jgi:hypothetical protein